jgi:hypothetical protein
LHRKAGINFILCDAASSAFFLPGTLWHCQWHGAPSRWPEAVLGIGGSVMHLRKSPLILKRLHLGGTALVLFAGAAMASPAQADGGKDCPPVGTVPGYVADDPPNLRVYEHADFTVAKGDDTDTVTVAGRYCSQHYLPPGDTSSVLEIQDNYRSQLTN